MRFGMVSQLFQCIVVSGCLACSAVRLKRRANKTSEVRPHLFPVATAFVDFHTTGSAVSATRSPVAERSGIFCYALARTPPEETVPLWKQAASAACDGSALFGHEANASLGIIRAYTQEQEQQGWMHQQEDMTVHGAWRHLAETGELWKYAWIVKTDTDSYIRPSALRSSLLSHDQSKFGVVSCGGIGGTVAEGWFIALNAATIDSLYDATHPSGSHFSCRPDQMYEVISGHNNCAQGCAEKMWGQLESCLDKKFGFGLSQVETFRDKAGLVLTAQPQNPSQEGEPPLPSRCRDTFAQSVLEFFSANAVPGSASMDAGFCGCKPGGAIDMACISRDVAIVHPIKEANMYQQFLDALP